MLSPGFQNVCTRVLCCLLIHQSMRHGHPISLSTRAQDIQKGRKMHLYIPLLVKEIPGAFHMVDHIFTFLLRELRKRRYATNLQSYFDAPCISLSISLNLRTSRQLLKSSFFSLVDASWYLVSMIFISFTASLSRPRWASSSGCSDRICMRSFVFSLLLATASYKHKNVMQYALPHNCQVT